MNPDCKYCPPHYFITHAECHRESARFRQNTKRLREVKENLPVKEIVEIIQRKHQLDILYSLSTTELEYRYFAKKLRRFNKVIEIFLEISNYR
jgi:hypothetical protein